jgi:hypothetical protein
MSTKDNSARDKKTVRDLEQAKVEFPEKSETDDIEIDIDELTRSIEERIDELLRPESEISFDFKTESSEGSTISEIIASEPKEEQAFSQQLEIKTEITESVEEPTLLELLERATISYLSLDWEFSPENLAKMRESVKAIESRITPVEETRILFKILEKLLDWFNKYENTVSSVSLALFRETLQFLTKIIQRDQKISDQERSLTEQFIKRFNILKKQYNIQEPDIQIKPAGVKEPEAEIAGLEEHRIEPVVKQPDITATEKITEARVTDIPSIVQETKTLPVISSIEDIKREIANLRMELEKANSRLAKVAELLSVRPKLRPVGERLNKIAELYTNCAKQAGMLETLL